MVRFFFASSVITDLKFPFLFSNMHIDDEDQLTGFILSHPFLLRHIGFILSHPSKRRKNNLLPLYFLIQDLEFPCGSRFLLQFADQLAGFKINGLHPPPPPIATGNTITERKDA
ncbi:hypothetical protein IFM89_011783, partial [Coptis chinensis]